MRILRYLGQSGRSTTASAIAPHVGLSVQEAADRLNELEWVGYLEEHTETDGSESAFYLTPDGLEAATS